jgi:hypothetical protein
VDGAFNAPEVAPIGWEGDAVVVIWDAGVGDGCDGCSASVEEGITTFEDGDEFEPVLSAVAVAVA